MCDEQHGLHLAEDHILVETVDPKTGDVLKDGETGGVFKDAENACRLLLNSDCYGKEANQLIKDEYLSGRMCEKYEKVYD